MYRSHQPNAGHRTNATPLVRAVLTGLTVAILCLSPASARAEIHMSGVFISSFQPNPSDVQKGSVDVVIHEVQPNGALRATVFQQSRQWKATGQLQGCAPATPSARRSSSDALSRTLGSAQYSGRLSARSNQTILHLASRGLSCTVGLLLPAVQSARPRSAPAVVPAAIVVTPTADQRQGARQELRAPVWAQVSRIKDPAVRSAAQRLNQTIQRASSVDPRATVQVQGLFQEYDQVISDLAQAAQQSLEYKTKTFQCLADHKECKKENGAFQGCGAALLACLILG